MANYTAAQMNAGVLGEVLTAGVDYTFTLTTPTYPSQSVYFGAASFVVDSSTFTNANLQGSSTNQKVGSLNVGQLIPLSNGTISCDANQTATIGVIGGAQGGGAILSLTSTGWDKVLGSLTGKITHATVTATTGSNFLEGDTITIPRGTPGIQGLGFTNADKEAIMDLFPDKIDGDYISSDLSGVFSTFVNDVSQSNFITSSRAIAFNIRQDVGSGGGSFNFNPTTTIPVSSYLLKSTGHFTLAIT